MAEAKSILAERGRDNAAFGADDDDETTTAAAVAAAAAGGGKG